MSVEIRARIICDTCKTIIEGPLQTKTTGCGDSYPDAKAEAEYRGWMFNLRYGPAKHTCNFCADGKPPAQPETIKARTWCEIRKLQHEERILKRRQKKS